MTDVWVTIALPTVPKTNMAVLPENLCPFGTFEGNPILSRKTGRYKSYILCHLFEKIVKIRYILLIG